MGIPADDDGVDDCDYAPTDDSDVDFNNDQELEAFIAELCPSEEVATNDQDQDASMAMADLLEDFFPTWRLWRKLNAMMMRFMSVKT